MTVCCYYSQFCPAPVSCGNSILMKKQSSPSTPCQSGEILTPYSTALLEQFWEDCKRSLKSLTFPMRSRSLTRNPQQACPVLTGHSRRAKGTRCSLFWLAMYYNMVDWDSPLKHVNLYSMVVSFRLYSTAACRFHCYCMNSSSVFYSLFKSTIWKSDVTCKLF